MNLERLYDYASRTLLKANLENRVDLLKEVSSLLREIKLGWDGIAPAAPGLTAAMNGLAQCSR